MLAYEIAIRNDGSGALSLEALSWNAEGFSEVVLRGRELAKRTVVLPAASITRGTDLAAWRKSSDVDLEDGVLPPGRTAVVRIRITAGIGLAVPRHIEHELRTQAGNREATTLLVATPARDEAVVLSPPLRGPRWLFNNWLEESSRHMSVVLPFEGAVFVPQRFAADVVRIGVDGRAAPFGAANGGEFSRFYGYGAKVFAVKEGKIARVRDGIEDDAVAQKKVALTLDTVAGNAVVIDLGDDRFAVYAHLRKGSLRVKEGDFVRTGDVIGELGTSGNSDVPHLHFQVCTRPETLACDGLPFVFDRAFERKILVEAPNSPNATVIAHGGRAEIHHALPEPSSETIVDFDE